MSQTYGEVYDLSLSDIRIDYNIKSSISISLMASTF